MSTQDTKSHLMDVAEQEVRRKGADGFSYADLSANIGIRKASIHYHFPKKSDLLTAIMNRYGEAVMTKLRNTTNEFENTAERLDAFLSLYRSALQNGQTMCLCVAYSTSQESLSDETKTAIHDFRHQVLEWLEHTFENAKTDPAASEFSSPQIEATNLLALVEGAQIASRITGNLEDFDLAVTQFRSRVGLAA